MHYRFWGLKIFASLCYASKIFSEGRYKLGLTWTKLGRSLFLTIIYLDKLNSLNLRPTVSVFHKRKSNEQNRNRTSRIKKIHTLSLDKVEATLNFVLSLKNHPVKKRPLGLLKGKVECAIDENFKMMNEEFLHS